MSCDLFRAVAPYTLIGDQQLATLHELSRNIADAGTPGGIVECGTCDGGSAAIIARPHASDSTRHTWLYDSWEGIPPAGSEDGHLAQSHTGEWKGTQVRVREVLGRVGYPEASIVWRKGLFQNTMAPGQPLPKCVALLHIDCDWHDSVLLTLRTFAPLVVPGGYIVLDDFSHWPGCRRAFYTWCVETGATPLVERSGKYGLWWQVGRESNVPNRDMS